MKGYGSGFIWLTIVIILCSNLLIWSNLWMSIISVAIKVNFKGQGSDNEQIMWALL